MAKIKGWIKVDDGEYITYKHVNKDKYITIDKAGKHWKLGITNENIFFFEKKINALNYARDYMRSHPNG